MNVELKALIQMRLKRTIINKATGALTYCVTPHQAGALIGHGRYRRATRAEVLPDARGLLQERKSKSRAA